MIDIVPFNLEALIMHVLTLRIGKHITIQLNTVVLILNYLKVLLSLALIQATICTRNVRTSILVIINAGMVKDGNMLTGLKMMTLRISQI